MQSEDKMNNMSSSTTTYATHTKLSPVKSFKHPTAEQAIMFDHVEGSQIRDYMLAIYKLVGGAQNIIAASRVSGGRVIIYLASTEIVNGFQETHGGFPFGENFIRTRRLKSPAKKIILSNVSPEIPNSELEKVLTSKLNLSLASPINLLRAFPKDDLFSHIICWRRQVYIQTSEEKPSLPSFVSFEYADHTYRIYINSDELTCFKCGNRGHKAEDCQDEPEAGVNNSMQPIIHAGMTLLPSITDFPPLKPKQAKAKLPPTPAAAQQKRGASTIDSVDDADNSSDTNLPPNAETNRQVHKKTKVENTNVEINKSPPFLSEADTEKVGKIINDLKTSKAIHHSIKAEEFVEFLASTRGSKNKTELARSFTENMEHLLLILDEIKPEVDKNVKKTITALQKALQQLPESSDSESHDQK